MTQALIDVIAERERQREMFNEEHEQDHREGDLATAGACYAAHAAANDGNSKVRDCLQFAKRAWPWDISWWKPRNTRRSLVKAAALIISEIELFDLRNKS